MSVAAAPTVPAECAGHALVDPHELGFPEGLALAIIVQTLRDLRGGSPRQRQDARCCVTSRALDAWIEQLDLPEDAARRVAALLESMARPELPYG